MTLAAARAIVVLAGLVLAVVVLGALGAGVLSPHDPNEQHLMKRNRPPAWIAGGLPEHPLGTDALGRDMLSRLLHGGRVTLAVSVSAVALAGGVGVALGVAAGFFGGALDELAMRVLDVQLAIPVLLLAVALIAVFDISLRSLVGVLGMAGWVIYARVIRSQVLSLREREFIVAARASGAGSLRIILRHIVPNVGGTCLVVATLEVAHVIALESALSFLGLGVRPPAMSWGSVLGDGRDYLARAWWIVTFPGLAISAVVLSVNLVGDALRDRLDPALRA